MRKLLSGLALIIMTAVSNNSNAVLLDTGTRFLTCDNQGCHAQVSGSCEYKGYTLYLSCDLEKEDVCPIMGVYDPSGKKVRFPDDMCPPKVLIQYPHILYCFDSKKCDKEFMCC